MAYYVTLKSGRVEEVFDSANGNIPQGAVEITLAAGELLRRQSNPGEYIIQGDDAVYSPPVQTLQQAQASAVQRINDAFEKAAAALTEGYPRTETLTWPDQQREALAWQADNNTPTPYLDALSVARGIPRTTYLAKTIAKIALFKAGSAALVGKRQKLGDQIEAATTAAECDVVAW